MSSENRDFVSSVHTEEYYEEVASQEQEYLDGVEENLREILTSEWDAVEAEAAREVTRLDEEIDRATVQLIVGDADEAPASEETIRERIEAAMIAWSLNVRIE